MFDFLTPFWDLLIYNPMLNGLLLLYSVIPNYGIAIVLFTLSVALVTMPLRIKSQAAMKEQQIKTAQLKPKLDEFKKKYKDNPQELQSAQMKLYQEHGLANPLNVGCLLQLLPFPIFIGLYNVITSVMGDRPEQLLQLSAHLYGFWPQLAQLVPVNPDFFGLNLAAVPSSAYGLIHPLTIIIVLLVVAPSWVQQKMMTPLNALLDPQQAQMNQSMQLTMPLMFGFFVVNAPIGLSVYWITFSLVGIVQQYFTGGWGSLFPQAAVPQRAAVKPKKLDAPATTRSEASVGRDNGRAMPTAAPTTPRSGSGKGKKKSGKKS